MGTLAHKFEADGIKKGKLEQAKYIALKMLRNGMNEVDIEKYTGLTLEQIKDLDTVLDLS